MLRVIIDLYDCNIFNLKNLCFIHITLIGEERVKTLNNISNVTIVTPYVTVINFLNIRSSQPSHMEHVIPIMR